MSARGVSLILCLLLTGCFSGCTLAGIAGEAMCAGTHRFWGERGEDHCYQWVAVKTENPETCEKIPGTGFTGQNPPKDKCYMRIAANTGNPDLCEQAKGGLNGYDRADCYHHMGEKGNDPDKCAGRSDEAACRTGLAEGWHLAERVRYGTPQCGDGWAWQDDGCVRAEPIVEAPGSSPESDTSAEAEGVRSDSAPAIPGTTPPRGDEFGSLPDTTESAPDDGDTAPDDAIPDEEDTGPDAAPDKREESPSDRDEGGKSDESKPAWEEGVDRLADLTDTIDKGAESVTGAVGSIEEAITTIFDEKPAEPTPAAERGTRLSELVQDVEDPEARSAIIEAFITERTRRDEMTLAQQRELLEEIRSEYEFNQLMDDEANTLKKQTIDPLTDKVNELVEEQKQSAWEKFKGWTYGWVKERSPDEYKETMALAEDRYNKAVEKYNNALESYNKGKDYFDRAKAAYDEVKDVMDNVRRLQEKVNQGRISEDRARVLKGGVLLGKGLEHMTKYIPVFGDTASTITSGTFKATLKFAEKRAERTTRLDKCIEDPLNCDPNGISAY